MTQTFGVVRRECQVSTEQGNAGAETLQETLTGTG